ncbi:MAG: DUF4419 domain-containing protein [Bacteroidales bacterium]|nr:DUF4419 domain-containing protein [Bacteroidales bacterium]
MYEISDYIVAEEVRTPKTQTIIIDVETLEPPTKLLVTKSYDQILQGILKEVDRKDSKGAYADHRPFELSPEALWLLICQGFSLHVNMKFYPYDNEKHRNDLKGLYDGASDLPPELSMVPLNFQTADGEVV